MYSHWFVNIAIFNCVSLLFCIGIDLSDLGRKQVDIVVKIQLCGQGPLIAYDIMPCASWSSGWQRWHWVAMQMWNIMCVLPVIPEKYSGMCAYCLTLSVPCLFQGLENFEIGPWSRQWGFFHLQVLHSYFMPKKWAPGIWLSVETLVTISRAYGSTSWCLIIHSLAPSTLCLKDR